MPPADLPLQAPERIGPDEAGAVEYLVDTLIVEGQRQQLWIRIVPEGGAWHNALVFRRDGKLSPMEAWTTGLDWHLPPTAAWDRAHSLDEKERLELYERALRPRPPII
ncbi:MAG TPA: hypothetical protein VMN78_13180 [Longimicrobiales bacterium]|nr:hypothetical protein [Longimicrobiales bacterium]